MAVLPGVSTTLKFGGTPTTFAQLPTTKLTANTVYQLTDSTKRIWDYATALVVETDPTGTGTWGAVTTGFTIDFMFGKVTFAADQGGSCLVRVSGKYVPTVAFAEAFDTEVEDMTDLIETTVYQSSPAWKSRIPSLQSASGTFSVLALLKTNLDNGASNFKIRDAMRAGTKVLLEFRPGGGADYWRGWVELQTGTEKAPRDGRIEGVVKFTADAPIAVAPVQPAVPTWGQ